MKKFFIVFTFLMALCISALQAQPYSVTVQVLFSDGSPVSGVTMSAWKPNTGGYTFPGTTDANGLIVGNLPWMGNGIGLTARYQYTAASTTVNVGANNPVPIHTFSTTVAMIEVKDCNNAAVQNCLVTYFNPNNGGGTVGTTGPTGIVSTELFPGTYNFRARINHTQGNYNVDITSGSPIDHTFVPTIVQFYNPLGAVKCWVPNSGGINFTGPTYMFPGTYNIDFYQGNTIVYTVPITLNSGDCRFSGGAMRLVDETGNPLANYPADYPAEKRNLKWKYRCGGSWGPETSFQTDANGYAFYNISCPNNNWDNKITMTLNQTSLEQNVAVNSTFQAAKVNVNLNTCEPKPLTGGVVAQGGGFWYTHGQTDANGTKSFYAFPGNNVKVRMSYNYCNQTINSTAVTSPTTEIDFVTTTVNLAPGPVKLGVSGWPTIPMPYEMLPGTYNFRLNGNQINGVQISGCDFSKTLLRAINELGQPVAGVTFEPACGGSWQPYVPGSTDANGNLFGEVPACMTKIRARVSGSSQELTKVQLIASNYTWTTEVLRMNFKDHAGNFITDGLGTIQSGGGWPTIGSFNASGYFEVNSFPATTGFRATYNNTTEQKNFTIVAGAGVQEELFQTGQVIGACITQYAANGWSTFTSGMELMPGTRTFRYPSQSGTVTAGAITYLTCPTSAGYAGNPDTPVADFVVFPNPFSKQTTIRYTMKTDDAVTVSIFDARGLEVTKLYQGFRTAGEYAEVWEGAAVPPGVYYLRILTSEGVTTHTIIKE